MELTMSQQDDPTPWASPTLPLLPPGPTSTIPPPQLLRGRGYFSHLGSLRTKPGRPDSPLALSKSCSDKLSSRTFLSLLLTPTTYLITPQAPQTYISTLTIPKTEFNEVGCARAFGCEDGDRLSPLLCQRPQNMAGVDSSVYTFHPFKLQTTSMCFPFSRRQGAQVDLPPPTPSNISSIFIPPHGIHETIISGVLQGRKAFRSGIQGASVGSKMRIWKGVVGVAGLVLVRVGSGISERDKIGGNTMRDGNDATNNEEKTKANEGSSQTSSYSHPELVQELMKWVISRKKYCQLKEPEWEIETSSQEPDFTSCTSSPFTNAVPSPLPPGPTIRLARFLAKQYIRGVLAAGGSGSRPESGWVRNGGNDFEILNTLDISDDEIGGM